MLGSEQTAEKRKFLVVEKQVSEKETNESEIGERA